MKIYREGVSDLCEHFLSKPYPRTHFCNDFLRERNDGQRIDHIVVSRSLGEGGLRVVGFETLQAFGGFTGASDHCPLWCRLESQAEEVIIVEKGLQSHPF